MYIIKLKKDLLEFYANKAKSIGFVPTMGALHKGHISLIEKSKTENDITICSIFVNPTQFNDKSDFEKYPITINEDIEKLIAANVDILFLPSVAEMYPDGTINIEKYNIGYLDTILDGKFRPGHFNGVSLIVHKLLDAVKPTKIYLGEKDFQQCLVIKRMIDIQKLNVEVITCPTLREEDGLAMSSRNTRLSKEGRMLANCIYNNLKNIKENLTTINFKTLQIECIENLKQKGFDTEYLSLADANNLELLEEFDTTKKMVVLIASKLDGVRLIDNMRLN